MVRCVLRCIGKMFGNYFARFISCENGWIFFNWCCFFCFFLILRCDYFVLHPFDVFIKWINNESKGNFAKSVFVPSIGHISAGLCKVVENLFFVGTAFCFCFCALAQHHSFAFGLLEPTKFFLLSTANILFRQTALFFCNIQRFFLCRLNALFACLQSIIHGI